MSRKSGKGACVKNFSLQITVTFRQQCSEDFGYLGDNAL